MKEMKITPSGAVRRRYASPLTEVEETCAPCLLADSTVGRPDDQKPQPGPDLGSGSGARMSIWNDGE